MPYQPGYPNQQTYGYDGGYDGVPEQRMYENHSVINSNALQYSNQSHGQSLDLGQEQTRPRYGHTVHAQGESLYQSGNGTYDQAQVFPAQVPLSAFQRPGLQPQLQSQRHAPPQPPPLGYSYQPQRPYHQHEQQHPRQYQAQQFQSTQHPQHAHPPSGASLYSQNQFPSALPLPQHPGNAFRREVHPSSAYQSHESSKASRSSGGIAQPQWHHQTHLPPVPHILQQPNPFMPSVQLNSADLQRSPPLQPPRAVSRGSSSSQLSGRPLQNQVSSTKKADVKKQPSDVSHVQIPVVKQSSNPLQRREVLPSPKRRRSKDVLVCEASSPQRPPQRESLPLVPIISSPLTELAPSQAVQPNITLDQTVDLQSVLLSLSDEYLNAARGKTSLVASGNATVEQTNECHALLAMAMGCLHTILSNYRQTDARKEARIRLQLASLMLEETENDAECAEVLSKGVALCERSRLSDAKFAMHHIEVRLLFKTKPKAALKMIDNLITEATEMKLVHWVYIFRFLRISFGLRLSTTPDTPRQLEHTSAIQYLADERSHVAVQITAACLETVVYLHSGMTDAVESAERSLTAARTHQLGFEMKRLPQLAILIDCLGLACNLINFNPPQIESSLQQMQNSMDKSKEGGWTKDGTFLVPLGTLTNLDIELDTAGIIKSRDGQAAMEFQWLSRTQVMAVGYQMSGLARLYNNNLDKKSEAFLKEGLKVHKPREVLPQSLASAKAELQWQAFMGINSRVLLMFAQCDRSDWTFARQSLQDLKNDMEETYDGVNIDAESLLLFKYLEAVIHHGLGELETASELYGAPELCFDASKKDVSIRRDCQALAALSHVQILRSRYMQQDTRTQQMLKDLEPYCRFHPNKSMQAAYHILRSTTAQLTQNTSILKKKQFLESAVRTAQSMKNNQILCMVLNLMREAFFNNIVGTQAEQNGRAARTLAKRTNSPLWLATAAGLYSQTLELCSMHEQAVETRKEGEAKVLVLPVGVRKLLDLQNAAGLERLIPST